MNTIAKRIMLYQCIYQEIGTGIVKAHHADALIDCAMIADEPDMEQAIVMFRENGTNLFSADDLSGKRSEILRYYAENDRTARFYGVDFRDADRLKNLYVVGAEEYAIKFSRKEILAMLDVLAKKKEMDKAERN